MSVLIAIFGVLVAAGASFFPAEKAPVSHYSLVIGGVAGAIYGIILLLVIYVMPSGAAGFVRLAAMRLNSLRHPGPETRSR